MKKLVESKSNEVTPEVLKALLADLRGLVADLQGKLKLKRAKTKKTTRIEALEVKCQK
jgi:hypothetical protein